MSEDKARPPRNDVGPDPSKASGRGLGLVAIFFRPARFGVCAEPRKGGEGEKLPPRRLPRLLFYASMFRLVFARCRVLSPSFPGGLRAVDACTCADAQCVS